jgi:hypothetical protein
MDIWMLRSIVLDIIIVRGNAGLVHARSWQIRSLSICSTRLNNRLAV